MNEFKQAFFGDIFDDISESYFSSIVFRQAEKAQTPIRTELIYNFCLENDRDVELLRWAIKKEIRTVVERAELFRSTSPCSVLLDVVMRKYGQKLLQQLLGPIVEEAIILVGAGDDEGSGPAYFELDSARCSSPREHEEALGNIMKVYTLSQKLMASILSSAGDWPREIKEALSIVRDEMKARFKPSDLRPVASFVFLRFLCAALCAPKERGIQFSGILSLTCIRCLVTVSKLMQHVANGIEFQPREQYLTRLNHFITTHASSLQDFVGTLSAPNTPRSSKSSSWSLTQPTVLHHMPPQLITPGVSPTASPASDSDHISRIWSTRTAQSPSSPPPSRSPPPPPISPSSDSGGYIARPSVTLIGARNSSDSTQDTILTPGISSTAPSMSPGPILPPKGNFVEFVVVLRAFWPDFENAFVKRRGELDSANKSPPKLQAQLPGSAGQKESALSKIFARRFGTVRSTSSSGARPKLASEYHNLDPNLSPRGSAPLDPSDDGRLKSLMLLEPIKRIVLTSDPISIQSQKSFKNPLNAGFITPEQSVDLSDVESQTPRSSSYSRSRDRPRPMLLSQSPFNNVPVVATPDSIVASPSSVSSLSEPAHLTPPKNVSKRKSVGKRRGRNASKSSNNSMPPTPVDSPPPQIPCSSCVLALSPHIREYIDHQVQREVSEKLREFEVLFQRLTLATATPTSHPKPQPRSSVDSTTSF